MKCIIGKGGWARVVSSLTGINNFFVEKEFGKGDVCSIWPDDELIIAIASPWVRERIHKQYPNNIFTPYIHPTCISYDKSMHKWSEQFIAPNCVFTINISIGIQAQINIGTVIGHDVKIGDYFTTSPNVFIGGNVTIGNRVHIGANASLREKINICDDVFIGMGSVVRKDIKESGVYFGNPLKKIKEIN